MAADYGHVLEQLALDGFSTGDSVNYYPARVVIERLVRARPDESDFD